MLRFLVIEDDEGMRTILRMLIKRKFVCELLEAENGRIGLELMKESIPDLVFLDISMPVMDGIETLKNIRSNILYKDIPVIIITAHNDKKTFGDIADKGITDYIVKPIDVKVAQDRIQKFIMRIKESKENRINGLSKAASSIVGDQLLLVDNDADFVNFFSENFRERFVIHSVANGVDGLKVFSEYSPQYVLISNKLSLLDKKILTQKLKDIAPDKKFLIYLLIDNIKDLSTKVFTYDGVINKSLDRDVFLKECETKFSEIKVC